MSMKFSNMSKTAIIGGALSGAWSAVAGVGVEVFTDKDPTVLFTIAVSGALISATAALTARSYEKTGPFDQDRTVYEPSLVENIVLGHNQEYDFRA